jgi:hypothetical protein
MVNVLLMLSPFRSALTVAVYEAHWFHEGTRPRKRKAIRSNFSSRYENPMPRDTAAPSVRKSLNRA